MPAKHKHLYLICYDISNDKIRSKTSELLEQWGERINLSVFECVFTHAQLKKVTDEICRKMDQKTDSIKIYLLCRECYSKCIKIGKKDNEVDTITIL